MVNIITSKTRSKARRSRRKYIMSPSELSNVKEEKHIAESSLRALEKESYGHGSRTAGMADPGRLRKEIKRYDKIIHDSSPGQLKSIDRDKLVKKSQMLRAELQKGICSKSEMNNLKAHPGAPHKNLMWERNNSQNISEYKQVMRQLEPGDPGASSIEALRQ